MSVLAISLPNPGSALGWFIGKAAGVAADAANATLGAVAGAVADAEGTVLEVLGTLWVRLNTPNIWSESGGMSGTVSWLHSEVAMLAGVLGVLGIIVGACRLAWVQRFEPARDLMQGLVTMVLVTGCGVPVVGLAVSASDAWAQGIIDDAVQRTAGGLGANVVAMLALSGPALGPMLAIFLGLVALLVSALQIAILAFRAGILVLVAGLLPIAAAWSTTQSGRLMVRKYTAWIVALIAWKPVCALIYAAAFDLTSNGPLSVHGAGQVMIGITLLSASVFALPALAGLLVPSMTALSIGGSGAASVVLAAAPTGAMMLARGGAMSAGAAAAQSAPAASGSGPAGPAGGPDPAGGGPAPGGPGPHPVTALRMTGNTHGPHHQQAPEPLPDTGLRKTGGASNTTKGTGGPDGSR